MRRPAQLVPWFDEDQLLAWMREATGAAEVRKRMVVWLTHFERFHAQEIARFVGVSVQAVWLWVGQYNRGGPEGLTRQGRGGRRWGYLTWEEEERVLASYAKEALRGKVITGRHLYAGVKEAVGRPVSLAYVYRLLHRHEWRKVGPRPRHVKAAPAAHEAFKRGLQRWLPPR